MKKPGKISVAVLGTVLILINSGCPRGRQEQEKPNLLLITVDGLSTERMGCYSRLERTPSPVMDGLAEAGITLECAIAPTMLSLPAHASLLSGQLPGEHGVLINSGEPLDTSVQTLALELQARGYRTAAVVGNPVLTEQSGINRGFELFDAVTPFSKDKAGMMPAADRQFRVGRGAVSVTKKAGDMLYSALANAKKAKKDKEQPWFLWINYADPMPPYRVTDTKLAEYFPCKADAAIAQVDEELGKLFKLLEMAAAKQDTLVVLAGGAPAPAFDTAEKAFKVPLIITHKGTLPKVKSVEARVGTTAVAATVFDLLGQESSASFSKAGAGIASGIRGDSAVQEMTVATENLLVKSVFGEQKEIPAEDVKSYEAVRDEILLDATAAGGGSAGQLDKLCKAYPDSALLTGWSGILAMRENDAERAVKKFRQADKLQPGSIAWRNNLAVALCAQGSMPQGLDMLDKLQEEAPDEADVYKNFTDLLLFAGNRLLEAKEYKSAGMCFQRLAQVNPRSTAAFNGMGELFTAQNMQKEAAAAWKSSLQLNPNQPDIRTRAGLPPLKKTPAKKPAKPKKN